MHWKTRINEISLFITFRPNKSLHLTTIPLCSSVATEHNRYAKVQKIK